jgi:hypothetical protein
MIATGLKAVITCVDPRQLRGEFHTSVWDGPGFRSPMSIDIGPLVERDGFVFWDVTEPGRATASGTGGG